ncbi:MAG: hypothetical protein P8I02_05760 [Flavobacteriales bacterium]|nr:hypothetical protein [Flavobacteriales bacterium]
MGLSLSIAYGVCCILFLILFSKIIGKLFHAFKTHAFALTYTSLFIKIIVVSTFTVLIKGQLEHKIIYGMLLLIGIMYSTVELILKFRGKN